MVFEWFDGIITSRRKRKSKISDGWENIEPLRNGQSRSGLRRAALRAALWYNNLRDRRGCAVNGKRRFPLRRTLYHQKALLLGGLVFVLSGAWVSLGVFVLNFILIL